MEYVFYTNCYSKPELASIASRIPSRRYPGGNERAPLFSKMLLSISNIIWHWDLCMGILKYIQFAALVQTFVRSDPVNSYSFCHFCSVSHYLLDTFHLQPMLNGPINWSPLLIHRKKSAYFWVELSGSDCNLEMLHMLNLSSTLCKVLIH